jgi:hypothetical protein
MEALTPEIQKMVDGYKRQQARCNKWKKEHPEQNCAYAIKYYHQMKAEDPIKYREHLDKQIIYYKASKNTPEHIAKRKEYYQNVVKAKKAKKAEAEVVL